MALVGVKIGESAREICQSIGMQEKGAFATGDELEKGGQLLSTAVKALAFSLDQQEPEKVMTEAQNKLLTKFRGTLAQLDGERKVIVPTALNTNEKKNQFEASICFSRKR